jgi:hypothetical protein
MSGFARETGDLHAEVHDITCAAPRCPYYHGDPAGMGECRHRSPRAHRMRYDANDYCSVWPPVNGETDFCGEHPALAALVRRGGVLKEVPDGKP